MIVTCRCTIFWGWENDL